MCCDYENICQCSVNCNEVKLQKYFKLVFQRDDSENQNTPTSNETFGNSMIKIPIPNPVTKDLYREITKVLKFIVAALSLF